MELLDEGQDEPVICEAVIGVVAYDDVIKNLNHQELAGPHKIPGQFPVFC